ncbi:MAG: DUF3048 domain-containing protein [Actinomycetota bacterium]
MGRLRARHWLAVLLALSLIVVAWRFTGNAESEDAVETTVDDGLASLPVDPVEPADDGQEPDELALTDDEDVAEPEDGDEPPAVVGPVSPFTGLPTDRASAERPALVVKVDNHPRARPQTGLDQADIVFDLRAEGITRFAAVFQSIVPEPVGPVRSSRTSDFDLLRGLDNPLYASSGANDHVAAGLRELPIVELTNRTRSEYFRDFDRPAPHNLYVSGGDLYALAPADLPVPEPWFAYRRPGETVPPAATTAAGPVSIAFTGSPLVTHEWDAAIGGWRRTQDGAPHLTVAGDQLAPENVVIFVTDYGTSPADPISPEVRSTGSGDLVVLTDGHVILGTWERPTAEDTPTLTDVDGDPIALTAGRTWVLMPEAGQVRFAPGQQLTETATVGGSAATSGTVDGSAGDTADSTP